MPKESLTQTLAFGTGNKPFEWVKATTNVPLAESSGALGGGGTGIGRVCGGCGLCGVGLGGIGRGGTGCVGRGGMGCDVVGLGGIGPDVSGVGELGVGCGDAGGVGLSEFWGGISSGTVGRVCICGGVGCVGRGGMVSTRLSSANSSLPPTPLRIAMSINSRR